MLLSSHSQEASSKSSVVMEKEQRWDQDFEEMEKEEGSLNARRSRVRNEGSSMESAAAAEEDSAQLKDSGSKTNGRSHVVEESVLDESEEIDDGPENAVAPAGNGVHKETEITEGHSKSNNCIYYDKEEEHIKQNHGDDALGITTANFGSQKNMNSVIDYEHEGIQKNVDLSIPQHSKILPEECTTSYNSSRVTEIETVGSDLVDESDLEGAELDVETVLQKQNTHDLYCPNCKSCITRRVVLRKRKRQIRISSEDVKRNKLETITDSTAKDSGSQATSGQGTSDIHLDGTSEFAANDHEREREPDIFRCLSCFSIFIPEGKRFKLFQIFGDRGKQDTMEDQQISSTFLSDRDRTIAESGDDVKNTLQAASGNQSIASNVSNDVAYFQADQTADVSTNRTPAPKGESQSDTISVYQPDGLKFLISTNVGSTTHEKLLKDKKPDLKIQNIHADVESILPMPPKDSESKDMDVNGKKVTRVEVFHEQLDGTTVPNLSAHENGTHDKLSKNDNARSYELPQQTIDRKKVEIHAGELLKIKKDAFVLPIKEPILIHGKQADTAKDLKKMTIEHHAGRDTVIVVEAGPSKTTDSQLLQDSNSSAETGTLPHLTTDIDAVEQMGADSGEAYEIEIIKSFVYGGLVESITSLGIVSSAAGGGTATLNILALAMANLIGGLSLVGHNLWELKKNHAVQVPNQATGHIDRYKELLGRRENFLVHATVAVLSFIIFGLISPITYAFSFQKSDDRDLKLLVAAAASLLCIVLLGTGKAYVQKPPRSYFKTVGYYVLLGFAASGISYAAGELIKRLLVKFHVLQSNSPFAMPITQTRPDALLWASY